MTPAGMSLVETEYLDSLKAKVSTLEHDLKNARCAAKMAMELVGHCKVCENRTEIVGPTDGVKRLLGEPHP